MSQILSVSPTALYERQRALTRLGILKGAEGGWRGSSVMLTADAVAALLASLLVTDSLSHVDERVKRLLGAPHSFEATPRVDLPRDSDVSPFFTKVETFGEALSRIISNEIDGKIDDWEVRVTRNFLSATINKGGGWYVNFSELTKDWADPWHGIHVEATLRHNELRRLIETFQLESGI
jgi:hypothetical protein